MGSPTCPGHGPLLFDIACCVSDALTALKGTAGPDVKAAVSNLEAARALIYARDDAPTPPAPADAPREETLPVDKRGPDERCPHGIPAHHLCSTCDRPPRVVYAVRYDDRTGRYAAAITRGGWDVLHLHVGSMRNTAENVRAVVDAMNAAHPADDAVEEATRALLRRLDGFVYGDSPHYDLPETDALHEALLAAERDAALRREKESRSDDSRPASGQGGA